MGSIGEQNDWSICFDQTVDDHWGIKPCPHAVNYRNELDYQPTPHSNPPSRVNRWRVPRVIVCNTQSGYDHTAICADCVLEALGKLDATGTGAK